MNSPSPIAKLDASLIRWRELAADAGESIDALASAPSYLRLKTEGRAGKLTGESAAAASEATAAIEQLWTWSLSLSVALAKADELRRAKGLFGGQDRIEEALALLEGPSIQLRARPDGLAGRELTPADDACITPEALLSRMNALFAHARDLALAAERGWTALQRLADHRTGAEALADEAAWLGCPAPAALSDVERLIAETEAAVEADPIGAVRKDRQIQDLLDKADAALARPRADAAETTALLDAAPQSLAALAELFADAARLRQARLAAIAEAPAAPAVADPCPAHEDWLATLRRTRSAGQSRAVGVGAGKWANSVCDARARLTVQRDADSQLLAAREDMRGRYAALSAKARTRRTQGLAPPRADALLARARSLLYGRATPMAEAAQVLRQLESALSWKDGPA
jgi:hypothetical protein